MSRLDRDDVGKLLRKEQLGSYGSARGEPYGLTAKGEELMPTLHALECWSRDFPKVDLAR